MPKVSVVIPARNEARNLPIVLAQMPRDVYEVIVVDGHSIDDTVESPALPPGAVIVQQTRKGKGNALAVGFAAVTGDIVVMFDADGSADPAEIPAFVAALVAGADFAKGSRFPAGGGSNDITPIRAAGNLVLTSLANLLSDPLHRPLLRLQRFLDRPAILDLPRRPRVDTIATWSGATASRSRP